MLSSGFVILVASLYLGGLFLLAFVSDRRAARGTPGFVGSPVVYTLSLAVYCTSWTFYGAVGAAARNGLEFLTIYIGPTLVLMGWWFLLRKLVRISKTQKITSIADFISARYGKSATLSAIVTVIAFIGVTPYIALQLKAVAASFDALGASAELRLQQPVARSIFADTGFWVAACMAAFVILFGTRNIGADERHPGVVAAIAFESIVKLFSLAAIAFFAIYGLNDGLRDMFARSDWHEGVRRLYGFSDGFEARWVATLFLSAAAIVCLPRQFQVAVVENSDERHLATAAWLLPLYLFLVSLFVIPIAIGGMTHLPAAVNPDLYVLRLPLASGQQGLALLAFIGGLSAATSMVIVASIALSIMISNHLVAPVLLRLPRFSERRGGSGDFSKVLLRVRRISIVGILSLGFAYYHLTGTASPLASIGLISFAGVAQFLPALVGGIYWQGGTKAGAMAGLIAGFAVWVYTLLVPSLAGVGWAFTELVSEGPWGIALLKPDALFGLSGWDRLVHGLFWSMTANLWLYVAVSMLSRQSPIERLQSAVFVNAFDRRRLGFEGALQRSATTDDLVQLTRRILGPARAQRVFSDYAAGLGETASLPEPDPKLIAHVERQLANSVGAASARSLISGIVKGESISLDSVISLLDETQAAIRYSRELEGKSRELEETAEQLRQANAQLTRLDRMKDDFLSRVSHELRTPMTSIRSFSEILLSEKNLESGQQLHFIGIIQRECIRLTRLLDEILDLGRMEDGRVEWEIREVDAVEIVRHAMDTMRGLAQDKNVAMIDDLGRQPVRVLAEGDRLKQVLLNLLSNAIKFNDRPAPKVWLDIGASADPGLVEIRVRDNGPGMPVGGAPPVFSTLSRRWNVAAKRRDGSGLGLAISRQIMQQLGGDLRLLRSDGEGCCFAVVLAVAAEQSGRRGLTQPAPRPNLADAESE